MNRAQIIFDRLIGTLGQDGFFNHEDLSHLLVIGGANAFGPDIERIVEKYESLSLWFQTKDGLVDYKLSVHGQKVSLDVSGKLTSMEAMEKNEGVMKTFKAILKD